MLAKKDSLVSGQETIRPGGVVLTRPAANQDAADCQAPVPTLVPAQGVESQALIVTPAMAARYLERNSHNRPLRADRARAFAALIRRGEWRYSHQGIAFDVHGRLLDGQHRLKAIVLADTPVLMQVTTGLPADTFLAIDQGAKRTQGDLLALDGYSNANRLAAAIELKWRYDHNGFSQGNRRTTPEQCRQVLVAHPGLVESAAIATRGMSPHNLLASSVATWLHYEFTRIDDTDGTDFWDRLSTGEHLTVAHPALLVRRRLLDNVSAQSKMLAPVQAALVIKGWNGWRSGKSVRLVRWVRGEVFPPITGQRPSPAAP